MAPACHPDLWTGDSMSGPCTGCGGSRWPTQAVIDTITFTCPLYVAPLSVEVEPVCRLVFFPPGRPLNLPDQSSFPSSRMCWSDGCLPPHSKCMLPQIIAAHHDAVEGKSLGKHDLFIRFLKGARRLNLPRNPHTVPSWDFTLTLRALQEPF